MNGDQIRRALEQSLTLERGLLQVSGLEVTYDLDRPPYSRLITVTQGGKAVVDHELYTVAVPGFLAEGGDLYDSLKECRPLQSLGRVSDTVVDYPRLSCLWPRNAHGRSLAPPDQRRQLVLSAQRAHYV